MLAQTKSADASKIRSHFAHLCQLSLADAVVTKDELDYLKKLCVIYGVSEKEFEDIMDNAFSIPFAAPDMPMKRLEQIYDLARMVLIDESIDERKVKLCIKVAKKLGFKAHIVGDLIKALVNASEETGEDVLEPNELNIILKES